MNEIILAIKIAYCYVFLHPSFIIKISKGKLVVIKGSPKGAFIYNCNEIVKDSNILSGIIYTQKGNYRAFVLKCSFNGNKNAVQQFRNAWINNK